LVPSGRLVVVIDGGDGGGVVVGVQLTALPFVSCGWL
jgi:hypothetical protein